jgi:hypothetical protein
LIQLAVEPAGYFGCRRVIASDLVVAAAAVAAAPVEFHYGDFACISRVQGSFNPGIAGMLTRVLHPSGPFQQVDQVRRIEISAVEVHSDHHPNPKRAHHRPTAEPREPGQIERNPPGVGPRVFARIMSLLAAAVPVLFVQITSFPAAAAAAAAAVVVVAVVAAEGRRFGRRASLPSAVATCWWCQILVLQTDLRPPVVSVESCD